MDRSDRAPGPGPGPGRPVAIPFPTPPRKRTTDSWRGHDSERKESSKKKWTLGGALGGSLGGLFRRRRKSDSSSSLEEEELETPPSARKHKGVGGSFLRKQRDGSNGGSKRKPRSNARVSGAFDHVVVTPLAQPYVLGSPPKRELNGGYLGNGILADNQFGGSFPKALNLKQDSNREWISDQPGLRHRHQDSTESGSLDGIIRRGRRDMAKARAAAIRDKRRGGSSSEEGEGEGSLHSNSSSLSRFRSDDSLKGGKDSLNRKSRAARTERYLKRLSKDEESLGPLDHPGQQQQPVQNKREHASASNAKNRWAARVIYTESSDYDTKVTVKALSANSSPVTSPPSRPKNPLHQISSAPVDAKTFPETSVYGLIGHPRTTRLRAPPEQPPKSPVSLDPRLDPANIAGLPTQPARNLSQQHQEVNGRSLSYDCNINVASRINPPGQSPDVMVVQLPVARVQSLQRPAFQAPVTRGGSVSPSRFSAFSKQAPPPPPPRDPQRRFVISSTRIESGRPMSYAFEAGNVQVGSNWPSLPHPSEQRHLHHQPQRLQQRPQIMLEQQQDLLKQQQLQQQQSTQQQDQQQHPQRYYHVRETPRVSRAFSSPSSHSSLSTQQPQQYTYYAEQAPRSRKPIHISTSKETTEQPKPAIPPMSPPSQQRRSRPSSPRPQATSVKYYPSNSYSPTRATEMPTSPLARRTRPRLRSADSVSSLSSDLSSPQLPRASKKTAQHEGIDSSSDVRSHSMTNSSSVDQKGSAQKGIMVKPIVQIKYEETKREPANGPGKEFVSDLDDEEIMKLVEKERKSTNLDDALSELEAIYNSLRLGDEDLLDRAERRDMPLHAPWATNRVTDTDSGHQFQRSSSAENDSSERASPRPRAGPRRSGIPDKVADDMAYRRLKQSERPPSQQDSRSIVSQAGSYLLVSTALSPSQSPSGENQRSTLSLSPEPDVTLDDVVYRNVRQANSTLKVPEHQPPFGIPLGPIAPSPNSDYLHATPQDRYRPTFKPRKTPDVVKDDLAFRNLRKDGQRDSAGLPPNPADAVPLHPTVDTPPPMNKCDMNAALRKKRAVRSLSANIFNMIQREVEPAEPEKEKQDFEKAQSVSDLAQVLQVAQKVQARKAAMRKKIDSPEYGNDADATPRASGCFDPSQRVGDVAGTSTETLTDSRLNLERQQTAPSPEAYKRASPMRPTPSPRSVRESICTTSEREESSSPSKSMSAHDIDFSALDDLAEGRNKIDGSLDSLLTEMAKEARATSEKLGREIEELVSEKNSSLPEAKKRTRSMQSSSRSPVAVAQEMRASRESVKSSHEAKNRMLKEQVLAQARCRSGSMSKDEEQSSSLDDMAAHLSATKRVQELSDTAKSQMESLQELTEMLSPTTTRRACSVDVPRSTPATEMSSRETSATKPISREASVHQITPSPRRTVSVSPGRSRGTESGDEDLPPVSARVQLWNQRHHMKLTVKPPPSNKVFNRRGEDEGLSARSSACRSVTASPQHNLDTQQAGELDEASDSAAAEPVTSESVSDERDYGADVVDAPHARDAGEMPRQDGKPYENSEAIIVSEVAKTSVEMDDVVPWRRRRRSSTAESSSSPATPPVPPRVESVPAFAEPKPQTELALVEPAVKSVEAPAVQTSAPRESSDSSDRDEDDKEVAALLCHTRPLQPAPRAQPRSGCPAGEGACRSTSPTMAPWYRDPESVLIACSYGLACAYHLADADFLTALGILLACLSLVAIMLIS